MFRLTIKEIVAKKLRLLSTAMAVILGVAFLAGTLVLTDTVTKTFDGLLADANAGTDAYVRGDSPLDLGFGEARPRIDAALVDELRHVDGVDQVGGARQRLRPDPRQEGQGRRQYRTAAVLGMNWSTVDELNPFRLVEGRAPTHGDEIVIDKHSADTAGFVPGDRTTVLTQGAPREFTIVGIAKFGTADSPGGSVGRAVRRRRRAGVAGRTRPGRRRGVHRQATASRRRHWSPTCSTLVGDDVEVITGAQLTKEDQDHGPREHRQRSARS